MMGWMAPNGITVPEWWIGERHHSREPSMSEVTAIGPDLRETRFQLHGVDVSGNMALGASNAR